MDVEVDLGTIFDKYGIKAVTKTDKEKGAFVPNAEQKAALNAAGFEPGQGGENATFLTVEVLGDPNQKSLETSYYSSMRLDPKRTPEPRMGRDFIHWVEIGEAIAIGNIGGKIYASKIEELDIGLNEIGGDIADTADRDQLLARARLEKGRPKKQSKTVSDFRRSLAVVAGALARANGSCETPNCTSVLFQKKNGTNFLEVHHIVPLGEGGDDTLIMPPPFVLCATESCILALSVLTNEKF